DARGGAGGEPARRARARDRGGRRRAHLQRPRGGPVPGAALGAHPARRREPAQGPGAALGPQRHPPHRPPQRRPQRGRGRRPPPRRPRRGRGRGPPRQTGRLVLEPALIALGVTLLRLAGELGHWSERWFSTETGSIVPRGTSWVFGITWLAAPFGIYFAARLARAGEAAARPARGPGPA